MQRINLSKEGLLHGYAITIKIISARRSSNAGENKHYKTFTTLVVSFLSWKMVPLTLSLAPIVCYPTL